MARSVVGTAVLALAALACGGSSSSGTGPTPVLTAVVVTPASPSVSVDSVVQLTAKAVDQSGKPFSGGSAPVWSSSDTTKANVDAASGKVTGKAAGTATITAAVSASGVTKMGTDIVTVSSSGGVSANVAVGDYYFSPDSINVAQGTTVKWTWAAQTVGHNVTFDNGGPASPTQTTGTFSHTFNTPGTFTYICTIHGRARMHGTVVVQ